MSLEFSDRAERAMALATEAAAMYNSPAVGPAHVLHGIIRVDFPLVLRNMGVDCRRLRLELERAWGNPGPNSSDPGPGNWARARAMVESAQIGNNYVGTEHLLLAVMRQPDAAVEHALSAVGVTPEGVAMEILRVFGASGRSGDGAAERTVLQRLDGLAIVIRVVATEIESLRDDLRRLEGK
jgi:ATP-dependent Clp protease ATP-binding subunit ClpC